MTVRDHSQQWLATFSSLRPESRRLYTEGLKYLNDLCGDRDPQSIEVADVRRFIEYLRERGNNNTTIRMRTQVVRRLFTWLADERVIPETQLLIFNPRRLPALPKVNNSKRPITRAEHEKLLAAIRHWQEGKHWWRTPCIVAWNTGLRLSDVAHLKWSQVDFDEEKVVVTPIKTRRLGKSVTIPMEPELAEHLLELRAEPYYDSPYVIPDMRSYYSIPSALNDQFLSLRKEAGVSGISFHCYRHAFVSRLVNVGVNPKIIATMTGQTVEQILSYSHVTVEAQRLALLQARKEMHGARLAEAGISPVPFEPIPT